MVIVGTAVVAAVGFGVLPTWLYGFLMPILVYVGCLLCEPAIER